MQKSPPKLLIVSKNHNPLTINLLPHQRYQKPLEATSLNPKKKTHAQALEYGVPLLRGL